MHFPWSEEWSQQFTPEQLQGTIDLAESCDFMFEQGILRFPRYLPQEGALQRTTFTNSQARGFRDDMGKGLPVPPPDVSERLHIDLHEPTLHERLEWETDLYGFTISGHPLDLFSDIAWNTYCPVARLGNYLNQKIFCCGLVIEQRLHHQDTGELMKFITLADKTGIVETELFAATYRSYGIQTLRYPVLEVEATVEPYENRRGFSLRVHRVGKPRLTLK